METIEDYRHIETREGLFDSKELPTHIPLMSHVQTLRKNDTKQDSTCIEQHLIKEQACFRSGKSCTSQPLNLTQHIEDGYEEGMITGTPFADLSAAYDTVNHRFLIQKSTTPRFQPNVKGKGKYSMMNLWKNSDMEMLKMTTGKIIVSTELWTLQFSAWRFEQLKSNHNLFGFLISLL